MTVKTDLQALADLCEAAAQQNVAQVIALGPRPADGTPAAAAWDHTQKRLKDQTDHLNAMAVELSAKAVVQALAGATDDLAAVGAVTKDAQAQIAKIKRVSDLLSTVGAVIDLGMAVLAVAGDPANGANLGALVKKLQALQAAIKQSAGDP